MRSCLIVGIMLLLAACQSAGIKNPLKKTTVPAAQVQEQIKTSYTKVPVTAEERLVALYKNVCLSNLNDEAAIRAYLRSIDKDYLIIELKGDVLAEQMPHINKMAQVKWSIVDAHNKDQLFLILGKKKECMFNATGLNNTKLAEEFKHLIASLRTKLNIDINGLTPGQSVATFNGQYFADTDIYIISASDDRLDNARLSYYAPHVSRATFILNFQLD